MSSREWERVDRLMREALRPYAEVTPPDGVWERIAAEVEGVSRPRRVSLFARLFSLHLAVGSSLPRARSWRYAPMAFGCCYTSPFVGVVLNLVWDRSLAF